MAETPTITPSKSFTIIVNSTAYFMLAYIFVITTVNFTSMLMARLFYGLHSTLYPYGFVIDRKDFTWTLEPVVLIFFIGVLIALLIGVFFQIVYRKLRKGTGHGKMFFLWGYLIAYTIFFGDIVFGAFINYMPGAFFNYMNTPLVFRVIIGILGLIMLFVVGQVAARDILISLNIYLRKASMTFIEPYFYAQLVFPFIIGNILIFLLKIPHHAEFDYIDTLVLLSMVIVVISVFFKLERLQSMQFTRSRDSFRLKQIPLIAAIVVILLFRIGLGYGISI